ncbi:hypothetical protein MMU07_03405 [Aquiflexum sp. LQ15W]|uniref:hypothetical protein n=1 Tax=Cognataquiflexum nitidum TaxID=2922272 RepID=UPI001F13453F|nr:hypothetical protein [Cognataquiflexum nitidum]MCH6198612.1 hypothetical protein [Cognataquiflexum nitidum]
MDIYTPPGQKVRYINRHGHDSEREFANLHLQEGAVYTLLRSKLFKFRTEIYLEEFPEMPFNSVMFENVK